MPYFILTYSSLGQEFNTFSLSVNSGTISPTTTTRTQLLSGQLVECNDGVTITITATDGPCALTQNIVTPALPGPTYFYYTLMECSGPGNVVGRSVVNLALGTTYQIASSCYYITASLGTEYGSFDHNLDTLTEVSGGCASATCTGGGGGGSCDCYTVGGTGGGTVTVSYTDCLTESVTTGSFNNGDIVSTKIGTSATIIAGTGFLTGPYGCVI